jgi:hypothetical protein
MVLSPIVATMSETRQGQDPSMMVMIQVVNVVF